MLKVDVDRKHLLLSYEMVRLSSAISLDRTMRLRGSAFATKFMNCCTIVEVMPSFDLDHHGNITGAVVRASDF